MGKTSSLKTILEQIKLLQKDKKIRLVITMAAVLLSAFIQAWAIQVFVRPAEIISGGFSGAAMLIERVGSLKGLTIPMQVTMILLNIPVALMCCRGISVRFTVVSLLQVVFGSIFLQIFSFQPIFTGAMHLPVVRTLSRCMYPIKQESPSGVMYSLEMP